jgi:DNA/RNA-binding domain of Phe-tRNA-synthetase-like protein
MMVMSYYKYGTINQNYKTEKTINCIESLEKRLQKYKETGNTEFLCDIANFAMIEFMFPQHINGHYKSTDSGVCSISGFGVNEIL